VNVAGYVRVSTEKQKEEGSHHNQRDALERWADEHGHEIEFFEDIAISGQSDDRESYDELLARAEEFDAIVVRELSRFGRSLQKVLNDIDDLHERGVDFISLKENIDLTTAQGQLFLNVIGAFNQFWADLARERANEMIQRRREEGKPVGRPKKVNDDVLEEIRGWHEKGLSYGEISTLVREIHGVDVSRSTIYRYCNPEQPEAEQ
jgi:DNA invertase Pin-like site-specific DNA recombinase